MNPFSHSYFSKGLVETTNQYSNWKVAKVFGCRQVDDLQQVLYEVKILSSWSSWERGWKDFPWCFPHLSQACCLYFVGT